MKATYVYEVIEYSKQNCSAQFTQDVTNARQLGDQDSGEEVLASNMKLIGNSGYGSMIMDKEKQLKIMYYNNKHQAQLKVNDRRFSKVNELETDKLFEVESAKVCIRINQNLPIQIDYMILQMAKLKILQFYYDFMDVFCSRELFEYIEMDTDSGYMAIAGNFITGYH